MGVKVWGGGGKPVPIGGELRVCGGSSFEKLSTDLVFPLHSPHQRHLQACVQPPNTAAFAIFARFRIILQNKQELR